MRFELIDTVVTQDESSLTAVKCVSAAEEYLQDHFPGFAVLPGVMMLEALAQAGRKLVGPTERPLVIKKVRNIKYANMVRPGQALTVEVTLKGRDGQGYDLLGKGTVRDASASGQGELAVQGRFTLAPLPED